MPPQLQLIRMRLKHSNFKCMCGDMMHSEKCNMRNSQGPSCGRAHTRVCHVICWSGIRAAIKSCNTMGYAHGLRMVYLLFTRNLPCLCVYVYMNTCMRMCMCLYVCVYICNVYVYVYVSVMKSWVTVPWY